MTIVNKLHMEETVKAAVDCIMKGGGIAYLRECFNRLSRDWHADAYEPKDLSLDVDDIARHLEDEPWVSDIAALPEGYRTWQMNVRVVEDFIHKYWAVRKEEITTRNVADVLLVADPLSRRHVLAGRVVIECVPHLRTDTELRRLNRLMGRLATNPRMENEFYQLKDL